MGLFSVLTQGFAMVAGEDDDRAAGPLAVDEVGELLQREVHIGDFAVVEPAFVLGEERLRGLVGMVRVGAVNPGEPGGRPAVEPTERAGDNVLGPPLPVELLLRAVVLERFVIEIEAPGEAEP